MKEGRLSHLALSDNGFLFDPATGHTYTLNSTGTFILKKLIEGLSREHILRALRKEYHTSKEVLSLDLDQFLHFLSELELANEE